MRRYKLADFSQFFRRFSTFIKKLGSSFYEAEKLREFEMLSSQLEDCSVSFVRDI